METVGAPHSSDAWRHCSSVRRSLMVLSYSRMRPQPVQVRLQACSGSSIRTSGKRLLMRGCSNAGRSDVRVCMMILNGFAESFVSLTVFCHCGGGLSLFFAIKAPIPTVMDSGNLIINPLLKSMPVQQQLEIFMSCCAFHKG